MDRTRFQQQQMTSGLTRYRSAPTSYFSTLMNSSAAADAGSITGGGGGGGGGGYARDDFDRQAFGRLIASLDSQDLSSNQQNPKRNLNVKQESEAFEQPLKQKLQKVDLLSKGNIGNYSGQARNTHTSGASTASTSAMDSSFGLVNSSNLTRFNTSPADFFDHMDIQNEYGGEAVFSSSSLRFKNHTSFSSGQTTSCSAPMDPISEIGDEGVKDEGSPRNHEDYASAFSLPPWEDSDLFSDYFLNPPGEKPLLNPNTSDVQKGEDQSRPPGLLSHHLSLPKSSAQLSAIMQDSVPCKVRAKRGCATHPRSIAERVRRTRISERMRKLQELVPNMDKQTNTADMLDLAVDYIKGLESKVKVLSENRAKCKCSGK